MEEEKKKELSKITLKFCNCVTIPKIVIGNSNWAWEERKEESYFGHSHNSG